MKEIKLNETPIRTSRNFNINNIKLTDFEIPDKCPFNNIEIINGKCILDDEVSNKKLVYGNGDILENNINKNANHKLRIITSNKEEIVEINYLFDDNNLNLINDIEVIANNKLKLFIKYKSNTDKRCFHNGRLRIDTKNNSKVEVFIINLLNIKSDNFESIENEIADNSNVSYTIIDIGGKNSITNYYSNIIGNKAKNNLNTVYLGINNQVKDMNYIAHLKGKESNVDIKARGALNDVSKKSFKGTIDFKKGCKKAVGSEDEYCMLLSDSAKSLALPVLLCTEDDVEGSHSSASGKADEEEIFYIMSRGISYKEAIKLMVKASFYKIVDNIKKDELKEEILNEIDNKLS